MERSGLEISMGSDGIRLCGEGIKSLKSEIKAELKSEIIDYINEEVSRVTDEKIKLQLERLNDAIKRKDNTLFDETIAEMIKSGASTIVSEIIKKVLLGV